MALSPQTESNLVDIIYSEYENDDDTWSATSAEYLTARRLCKAAIMRWEYLEGTRWPELFVKLEDAADGDTTTTAGDFEYACPTNMRIPPQVGDYVRINGVVFPVVPLTKIQTLTDNQDKFCYFTGNPSVGYTLNINPNVTLSTGDTIAYEYYKNATYFTTTTSSTEMSNPMFIVHFVLHKLYRNDGLLNESREELQIAENILQEMRADAQVIDEDISEVGFGV